jgi:hypothetical protein
MELLRKLMTDNTGKEHLDGLLPILNCKILKDGIT